MFTRGIFLSDFHGDELMMHMESMQCCQCRSLRILRNNASDLLPTILQLRRQRSMARLACCLACWPCITLGGTGDWPHFSLQVCDTPSVDSSHASFAAPVNLRRGWRRKGGQGWGRAGDWRHYLPARPMGTLDCGCLGLI